jgi:hypothetical protein
MFGLPVATVRRVLRFAYKEQWMMLYEERRLPLFPRDYELERVMIEERLAALET